MRVPSIAGEIKNAMGARGAWKLKLRTAISTGRSDVKPVQVRYDDGCAFGQGLRGPSIDRETRQGMPCKVVRRLHAEFLQCAGDVLTMAIADQKEQALALLEGEYSERSDKLVRALMKWRGEVIAA